MLVSVFLGMFLPCAGMTTVVLVYIILLCCAPNGGGGAQLELHGPVKAVEKKGLSAADLEKLPKVTGKDLVLANDCAVCLDEIESEQPARVVPGCNHGFHLECADAWLSKNPVCPVCRAAIGPELFSSPPETDPC
ncbi:hypothetical protein ABFS82_03G074600 [Erythranthe guttata]